MNASRIVGIGAALALAAAGIVAVTTSGDDVTLDKVEMRKDFAKGDIASESHGESKVAWLPDGTKIYEVPVVLKDGGRDIDKRPTTEAPCKRRPKGIDGALCQYKGKDAPELNRYPAAEMIGPGCQGCACSVWLGEDADAEETKR